MRISAFVFICYLSLAAPAVAAEVTVIPYSPVSGAEFSGIALLAPISMSVELRAMDTSGTLITGAGVRNPVTVTLTTGQQYARLITEIFGISAFDGWMEAEASNSGLSVFTAVGSWDLSELDGYGTRELSADFVLFHAGASAIFVNPSARTASVTITSFGARADQSLTIPPRSRVVTLLPGVVRVRSSEGLAAIEQLSSPGKLVINAAVPISDGQSTLVFPQAVIGGGYASTLTVASAFSAPLDLTITYGASAGTLRLDPNSATRISLASFLRLSTDTIRAGAVRVSARTAASASNGLVLAALDIESETGSVVIGARPATTEAIFPHVAHGNGLFTGLAFAAGDRATTVQIEVYEASGARRAVQRITLEARQQLSRLISELVSDVTTQMGGYIRIRSDQPIWSWEIYGSDFLMASAPPMRGAWTVDLSHGSCTGSTGPGRLTASPMKLGDIAMILPLGTMVGGHVTPIDHQYYSPAVARSAPDTYEVYSAVDGYIVSVGIEKEQVNPPDKISVFIESSCTFWVWYNLLTSLTPEISQQALPMPGQTSAVRVPVKAGQLIGYIGGRTLDFSVVNSEITLSGFVVPEHYTISEPWKVHVVDPFDYYVEPIRSQLLAIDLRRAEPRGGKIDYDIDGRLIGNWFLEGTPGYLGVRFSQPQLPYALSHLAIVPDAIDPSTYTISLGSLLPNEQNQFGIRGNAPDPARVSVATGLVVYELVQQQFIDASGQIFNFQRYAAGVRRSDGQQVMGTVLMQMLDGRHVKVEVFMGKNASQVNGFTDASQIYGR